MYDGKTQDIALKYEVKEDRAVITLGKPVKVFMDLESGYGRLPPPRKLSASHTGPYSYS